MSIGQALISKEMYGLIVERDEALAALKKQKDGVTVCIPTFNDAVEEAVASVKKQTVPPLEIIVVDDGSHKPVTCDGVKVVRVTNRGLPAARNVALMLAKGDAFLPLDADDWIDPRYIEKTLPLLEHADVVLTGLQEHGPTRNNAYMPGYDRPYDEVDENILWHYNRFFYCSLFRTETLREVGGYNPRMAGGWGVSGGFEDWDLWIDLKRRNKRFAAVNEVLFHYRTKPDSMLVRAEQNREKLVAEMRRHHQ